MSTLTRLADGDVGILAALAGFLAGVSTWIGVQAAGWPAGLAPVVSPWLRWPRSWAWPLACCMPRKAHGALSCSPAGCDDPGTTASDSPADANPRVRVK